MAEGSGGVTLPEHEDNALTNHASRAANKSALEDALTAIKDHLSDKSNCPAVFNEEQWDGLKAYIGGAIDAGIQAIHPSKGRG